MEHHVVHRIIEEQAARRGDLVAVECEGGGITYRDLNHRANAVARELLDQGFQRGGHVIVRMMAGADLATVLLAVLKAGGAYTWLPGASPQPPQALLSSRLEADHERYRAIDLVSLVPQAGRSTPNLPILTRPTDTACVLSGGNDGRDLVVPHSTITALRREMSAGCQTWEGDPSAFDLWTGLMAGTTLSVARVPGLLNAA